MIVSVTNRKGGVGKTTLAVALATKLANAGRVLLVDLDGQANATESLGVPLQPNVFNWLGGEQVPTVVMLDGGLEVLAGDAKTERVNLILASEGDVGAVDRCLEPLKRVYQYIILDCPPSMSMLTRAAIYAADYVLCPTLPEYLSLAGVRQLTALMSQIRQRYNRGVQLMGIQPNKYDARTVEHRQNLLRLVQMYGARGQDDGIVWPPLRQRIAVAQASADGKPLWEVIRGPALQEWVAMVERVKAYGGT